MEAGEESIALKLNYTEAEIKQAWSEKIGDKKERDEYIQKYGDDCQREKENWSILKDKKIRNMVREK